MGLSIVLGASASQAQMPADRAMPQSTFHRLEQPLGAKIGVAIGGFALIGLELWWFLGSKPQPQTRQTCKHGVQAIGITVDGGYDPAHVLVHAGTACTAQLFSAATPVAAWKKCCYQTFHIAQTLTPESGHGG